MKTRTAVSIIGMLLLCAAVVEMRRPNDRGNGMEDTLTDDVNLERPFPGSCTICQMIVSRVKKALGNDTNVDHINQKIHNVCSIISIFRTVCKRVLHKYKQQLIDALHNCETPRHACVKLTLCSKARLMPIGELTSRVGGAGQASKQVKVKNMKS